MGTNYYRVHKLSRTDKEVLKSSFSKALDEVDYVTKVGYVLDKILGARTHIGKSSCGWKFLFNTNHKYFYDLTRESIDEFIRDGVIVDEYGREIDPDEFWEMVDEKDRDGMDSTTYYQKYPDEPYQSKFDEYHDGLRFSIHTEFS